MQKPVEMSSSGIGHNEMYLIEQVEMEIEI